MRPDLVKLLNNKGGTLERFELERTLVSDGDLDMAQLKADAMRKAEAEFRGSPRIRSSRLSVKTINKNRKAAKAAAKSRKINRK